MPSTRSRRLFAAVVFLGSVVVLATQLINPSPVMVTVGEDGSEVAELGSYFQYQDVAVIASAAFVLGVSATYLLLAGEPTRESAPEHDGNRTLVSGSIQASADGGETEAAPPDHEPSDELLAARRQEWEETAAKLANKEREVYETLLEADGVLPQSEIVDHTDLSKASVSRALDGLEVKNLVERKRRGMGNVVYLL